VKDLIVGTNNLNTRFDGVISGSGGVSKVGLGRLSLTNANTYTGGTTVSRGALLVSNVTGSATGTGPVTVSKGTFGGTGLVSGAATIGTATAAATLAPGGEAEPGTLSFLNTLTLNSLGSYKADLNSDSVTADQVIAVGITINSGATIILADSGSAALPSGTVFTIISNTAATPIGGSFSNLADGATVTIGNNTYQADYHGGDGNDLTLTVVP
jgi:autotransporter-associated beta strand protein